MPQVEEFHLRPSGWQHDPDEEWRKLSTLDYLCAMTYTNFALFFECTHGERRSGSLLHSTVIED
jgi:hypothetical protein